MHESEDQPPARLDRKTPGVPFESPGVRFHFVAHGSLFDGVGRRAVARPTRAADLTLNAVGPDLNRIHRDRTRRIAHRVATDPSAANIPGSLKCDYELIAHAEVSV